MDDRPVGAPVGFRATMLRAKATVYNLPTDPLLTLTRHVRFELNPEPPGALMLLVLPQPITKGSPVYRVPIPKKRAVAWHLQKIPITKTGSTLER